MSTDPDTIDSYDQYAEKWAKGVKSGKRVSHLYLEKPAMYGQLPDLSGFSVLCLGCGSGEECDYIKKQGAARVVGTDISKGLIEQARYTYPEIEFMMMDMQALDFPSASFDLVFSSLALHYVEDWTAVIKSVAKVLKPGGRFLFSTHHPIYWSARKNEDDSAVGEAILGFREVKPGEYEIYGDYLNPRQISDKWFGSLNVKYWHKPLSQMLGEIHAGGMEVLDCLEPKSLPGAKKVNAHFYDIHQKIPLFIIFELRKR